MRIAFRSLVAAALVLLAAGGRATAASTRFAGYDPNSNPPGPLASHPNSDNARYNFLSALSSPVTNDLELFKAPVLSPFTVPFGGVTATVTLPSAGGLYSFPGGDGTGKNPISGAKLIHVASDGSPEFRISFSEPVVACGFYIIDATQPEVPLNARLTHTSGPDTTVEAFYDSALIPTGSVAYFGVISTDNPFTSMQLTWAFAGDDFAIDDITIQAASGGGGGVGPPPPSVGTISQFFLPRTVTYRPNTATPAKSTLRAIGTFDTGPGAVDFTKPFTVTVGGVVVDAPGFTPNANGTLFTYKADGLTFIVKPAKTRSSKGRFNLALTRDMTGLVNASGRLALECTSADLDASGDVALSNGGYKLGKLRGALYDPDLALFRIAAKLGGEGKDAYSIRAGIPSEGRLIDEAFDLRVEIGSSVETIPAAAFTRKGSVFTYKGGAETNITSAVVDFARERLIVNAKGVTIGDVPEGDAPLTVRIVAGGMDRTVNVRAVRKGAKLVY